MGDTNTSSTNTTETNETSNASSSAGSTGSTGSTAYYMFKVPKAIDTFYGKLFGKSWKKLSNPVKWAIISDGDMGDIFGFDGLLPFLGGVIDEKNISFSFCL